MLDVHEAVSTEPPPPAESDALPQDPEDKGRGNRDLLVWMQYVTLRQEHQSKRRTISHHRGTMQETRPPDDFLQPCSRDNWMYRCKSVETSVCTRRLSWAGTLLRISWAGTLLRMSGGRGCQIKPCSGTLRVQCGEDGARKRKSGSIA